MAIPGLIPALVSGGASLLGGLFNSSSSSAAQKKNYESQKEFAQHGIRWKVEDAKAAGIHPLYAMGANTTSFSPSYVGDTGVGSGIADMGQDISRAIDAGRTGTERAAAVDKTVRDLQLTRMGLENELLASQIRKVNQAGHPPSRPAVLSPAPDPNTARGADISGQTVPAGSMKPFTFTGGWPTAEEVERQWGDIGQNVYGVMKAGMDIINYLNRAMPVAPGTYMRRKTRMAPWSFNP